MISPTIVISCIGGYMEEQFEIFLNENDLSKNTITAYLYALRQYIQRYKTVSRKSLREYKMFLIENYNPRRST